MPVEYDPTPGVPDRWLLGQERLPVTSVGILLTDSPLSIHTYFYFVEQADHEIEGKHPWGIPAGRVNQETDRSAREALGRELSEETGLLLPNTELFLVCNKYGNGYSKDPTSAQLVFTGEIPFNTLISSLGAYNVHKGNSIRAGWEGTGWERRYGYYQSPSIYISRAGLNSEIGRRALVPADRLFERFGPIGPWRKFMHNIKAKLEGLRVI